MKHELAVLGLWLLAVVPTLILLQRTAVSNELYTYLGPLYFICMVGTIYIVRSAKKKN